MELRDELWFIEFGRGLALPETPEEARSPAAAKRRDTLAPPRRGLSLDRLRSFASAAPTSASAPASVARGATVDCAFQFTSGPPARPPRGARPPLRKSVRVERAPGSGLSPEPPEGDAACRRRRFRRSARQRSFDEGPPAPGERSSEGSSRETERFSSVDSDAKYHCDKSGSSTNDFNLPDREFFRPEVCACNDTYDTNPVYDKRDSFRTTRARGASSDRILAKKLRCDQKSVSSLAERITNSSGSTSSNLFEKHLGKFYKIGKLDKCNRMSTSALYDRSPTEAFYNKTGSARLSSQELFEKFCSEDFISLYGHEHDNGRYSAAYRPVSKPWPIPGTSCRSESVGACGDGHGPACYRGLEYPRAAAPHANVRCGSSSSPRNISTSHGNLGANPTRRAPTLAHRPGSRPLKIFDYSTDTDVYCSSLYRRNGSKCDVGDNINLNEIENDLEETIVLKEVSLSAPLLSPSDVGDTRFTFDISEKSEAVSPQDDSPSDATETRNLTLYEDPNSDRTSLSDFYDSCFSTTISSKQSSLRRNSTHRKRMAGFDLTNLNFRPIDDESPNTSKYASLTSPDYVRQNSDSKSWYSDSVFATPEKRVEQATSQSWRMVVDVNAATARGDSTPVGEDPDSVIDTIPEIFIENFKQLSLDSNRPESQTSSTDKTVTPHFDRAADRKLAHENETSLNLPVTFCSRPSMHKLEPIDPKTLNRNTSESLEELNAITYYSDSEKTNKMNEKYHKVLDPPELKKKGDRNSLFKLKRVRDASEGSVAVQRQSRCFPL